MITHLNPPPFFLPPSPLPPPPKKERKKEKSSVCYSDSKSMRPNREEFDYMSQHMVSQ